MIFIKRIIIFINVFKIKFIFSPRYILVYYFGKVTITGGVTILTMPQDMRSWHVTFLRYETSNSYTGEHMARYLRDLLSDEIAKYLRKLFPSCTNLIMPQNRPRTYRRIRK